MAALTITSPTPIETSNISGTALRGTDHLFVNNVRFLCIVAIVGVHSAADEKLYPGMSGWWPAIYVSWMKFGTIGFFLISGFLLGERFQAARPLDYVAKRIRRIFIPWCVWMVLFTLLCRQRHGWITGLTLPVLGNLFWNHLWYTSFWFVPNLLFAMTILLLCRRWLYDPRLGAVLLLFNLFYAVNIYACWISSIHTLALFGFVFYLWLGANVAHRFARFNAWMRGVPVWVLLTAIGVSYLLALSEAGLIMHLHLDGPSNTIRLSNQIFSVLMVCLIFKVRRRIWPSWLDVRQQTFGIYLSHMLVLSFVASTIKDFRLPWQHWGVFGGGAAFCVESLLAFGVTISLCCLLTRWMMSKPSLAWMISATAPSRPMLSSAAPLASRA